jgi:hypothetical protein
MANTLKFKKGDKIIISHSKYTYIKNHNLIGKVGIISRSGYFSYLYRVIFPNGEEHEILDEEMEKITDEQYFLEAL